MNNKKFSPLSFLASLGAGGISVIPFSFLQYTFPHGEGLVKMSDISHGNLPFLKSLLLYSLEGVMVVFTIIHLTLTIIFLKKLIQFIKDPEYKTFINDPLKNIGMMAPFTSLVMTMNVFIGPIRYFIPQFASNLQAFMLPALIIWGIMFVLLLRMEIKLLKIAFVEGFDINKITFGWLLHPFALGMLTVTGTGIAAIAKDPNIAHTAAFMSFTSGSMGMFLLLVKIVSVFQKHFASKEGLGEKHFMPSFLLIIPNITLYAISMFRIGHYLEKQHHFHMGSYFLLTMTIAFAFETWYLAFGLSLLKDYFKKYYFKKEFYLTQWGLICPIVAYAILSAFVYKFFVASPIFYYTTIISLIVVVLFYVDLLIRNMKCAGLIKSKMNCEG